MSTFQELLSSYDQRSDGRARGSHSWAERHVNKMRPADVLSRWCALREVVDLLSDVDEPSAACLIYRGSWLGVYRFTPDGWSLPGEWAKWDDQSVAVAVFGDIVEPARGNVLVLAFDWRLEEVELSPEAVSAFRSKAGWGA